MKYAIGDYRNNSGSYHVQKVTARRMQREMKAKRAEEKAGRSQKIKELGTGVDR